MSNELIYAMSTIGSLTVNKFNNLLSITYKPEHSKDDYNLDYNIRRQAIRVLESLGYCEFDFDNNRIYMCKPSLILIPSFSLPTALLVGARSPKLIESIKKAVKKKRKNTKIYYKTSPWLGSLLPVTIHIEATDVEILENIAREVGIDYDLTSLASMKMVKFSVCLEHIVESLNFEKLAEPSWNRKTFNKDILLFTGGDYNNMDLYLCAYQNPDSKQLSHWLWGGDKASEINRDWGRYVVLRHYNKQILLYDKRKFEFAVPITVPMPTLLARAAALSSGLPPKSMTYFKRDIFDIPDNLSYQIYESVSLNLAESIASKLDQKLLYADFDSVFKEGLYA